MEFRYKLVQLTKNNCFTHFFPVAEFMCCDIETLAQRVSVSTEVSHCLFLEWIQSNVYQGATEPVEHKSPWFIFVPVLADMHLIGKKIIQWSAVSKYMWLKIFSC